MTRKYYKIGELARLTGVSVETLRYYGSQGLIEASERSASGYRLYQQQDLNKLFFLLQAKKVGFSLAEIRLLLEIESNKSGHTCEQVKQFTANKIDQLNAKITDLQTMSRVLTELHQACCGGDESAMSCSILKSLQSIAPHNQDTLQNC